MRHREVLGEAEFQKYLDRMDTRQRNTFRILSQSFEDKDFHVTKRRPKDGVSFGMIPNCVINKLLDKQNRTMRAEGALMLIEDLKDATEQQPDRFDLLLPYMGSFIKFLGNLLQDASPKVNLSLNRELQPIEELIKEVPECKFENGQQLPPVV